MKRESAMIIYKNDYLRISLITDRLLRTEIAANTDIGRGVFTDLLTQTVMNRDFCEVKYKLREDEKYVEVQTSRASFKVKKSSGKGVEATWPPHV